MAQTTYKLTLGGRHGLTGSEVDAILQVASPEPRSAVAAFNEFAASGEAAASLPGDAFVWQADAGAEAILAAYEKLPAPPAGGSGARPEPKPVTIYRVCQTIDRLKGEGPKRTNTYYCGPDRVAARAAYLEHAALDVENCSDYGGAPFTRKTVVEEFDADAPLTDQTPRAAFAPKPGTNAELAG